MKKEAIGMNNTSFGKILTFLGCILLFASLTAVVSAGSYDNMELVANTTSDVDGYYTLDDIPNGNYTLIGINESDRWRKAELEISVNGDRFEYLNTSSMGVDEDEMTYLTSLLDRSVITGQTFRKVRNAPEELLPFTTVLLFNSVTDELVANTTSDVDGYYTLDDIPNGNYTLIGINESDRWRKAEMEISVNGDRFEYLNTSSMGVDENEMTYLTSLLDRSVITGQTFRKVRNAPEELLPFTTVLLFNSVTDELVANTTSDVDGYYKLDDIPNGNYTLIGINESDRWRKAELEISVNGDRFAYLNTSSMGVDEDEMTYLTSLLDRSVITGQTFRKVRNAPEELLPFTTVILLKEKTSLYPPVANFSVNETYGDCPLTVQFNDLSENATSWYWDFGDGENSTEQNPVHTYDSVGFFNVKLKVSNSQGSNIERRINLITTNLPDVNRTHKILFLVIGDEEAFMVKKAVEDMGMDDWVDVYSSGRENNVEIMYTPFDENITMNKYDTVFVTWKGGMSFLGANLESQIHEMINEANPGTFVYDHNYGLEDFDNINYVNHTKHPYLEDYWMEQYDNNIVRLITYLSVVDLSKSYEEYNGPVRIEKPSITPTNGIVHPDAGYEIFENLESYLEWYSDDEGTHHVYNPANYTVGVIFFASHDGDMCDGVTEGLIEELESRGVNVIPTFRPGTIYDMEDAEQYFKAEDEWKVDSFIDIGMGVSSMSSSVFHTEALQQMNVPVINGIQYQGTIEEWEESATGQDGRFQYQIPIMEIGGEIESIVIGGKVYNEEMDAWTFQPIDYQMKWMVNRTVRWMDLQRIENKDKKVAIIYYNHGKQEAMVAANLDVAPSIPNLLMAMNESGYDLDGMQLNRSEFTDLVLQQGRNIGTWAPGELNKMVENYEVELLPVETYLNWFDELEPDARQSVIDTWGEAPGEGMVYENETGQYFVFPKIEVGNVLIAPQPTRGLTNDDSMLYHNQSVPPSHNYIAFYLWLNEEVEEGGYDTDAVVHFGRHGTQEWLAGKSVGLSSKECWPAILIQDIPVVYLYDVGGVGEGITAKRRGNAVMVDHLTAPIVNSGLYGNLTLLHDTMHNYEEAEGSLKQKYKESIIDYYEELDFEQELGTSPEDLYAMENESFDNFILYGPVHDYLHDIADSYMPYGLHILGEDMSDEGLIAMVKSMLGKDFREHINVTGLCDDPDDLSSSHSPNVLDELLEDVLVNGTDPMDVVIDNFNIDYSSGQYYADSVSNESGVYDISFIKDGKYTVYALKQVSDGWLTGKDYITIKNGNLVSGIQLNLSINETGTYNHELEYVIEMLDDNPHNSETGSGSIYGQVSYPGMSGITVRSDSTVVLLKDGEAIDISISDSEGNYIFTNLSDGDYVVSSIYQSSISEKWYVDTANTVMYDNSSNNVDLSMIFDNENAMVTKSLIGEVSGTTYSNETFSLEHDCQIVLIRRMSDNQMTVVEDLYNAIGYANAIHESTDAELQSMINALDGKYIASALGDDPTRSPDEVLPTGKNFYAFNPNVVPTKESWDMGKELVDEFLEEWKENHEGKYPEKVGFVLWSSESMRHKGVMESEIMYMLGVKPVWGSSGKVEGVEIIDEANLGRPRIDVVVTMTGVYRDNWKWQVQLMDRAVRLAAQEDASTYENYVKDHSDLIYDALMDTGNYDPAEAKELSMCRLFGPDDGSWGIGGLTNAVDASGSWDDEEKLANLYIDSLGYIYGDNIWALKDTEVFRNVLANTEAVLFSRSGNSGRGSSSVIFDHTYEFFGGFGMAVRNISGYTPEMFIVNLKDPNLAATETLGKYLSRELRSQYWNPEYIRGMMGHGYIGAGELDRMLEDFWGLTVMLPDEVTDDMWNEFYDIYVQDKYDLGLDEWFDQENPWAKQSMAARMLEAARKDYWDASDEVIQSLVKDYVESVVNDGVTCCHHTCGNMQLADFTDGLMQAAGLTPEMQQAYRQAMYEATLRDEFLTQQQTDAGSLKKQDNSLNSIQRSMASGTSNQTSMSESGGAGVNSAKPVDNAPKSTPDNYVEGYEMTQEVVNDAESANTSTFSSSDILASVFVVGIVGAIYLGFWRRRQF
ncbi:cobaltochelatase subunit CobN [Methanolobus sp. WCC1]|uniref:cobaltochelatase subunit CobN n=1 Tax=unclassified Methanolobus TaxID=2629569 RepID=UPI00324371E3